MKKILHYLNRDLIDLILLILFLSLLIKAIMNSWWLISPYIIAGIVFTIIYTLGVMWRMGGAMDSMNENIKDLSVRQSMGMNPYKDRHKPINKNPLETIFRYAFLIGATTIIITQIILA